MLQSLIARAMDNDCFVALAGIDLNAAFDVVDVELLIKRPIILGLRSDIVKFIKIWLEERYFYVSIRGSESTVKVTWHGIVKNLKYRPCQYYNCFEGSSLYCKGPLRWAQ